MYSMKIWNLPQLLLWYGWVISFVCFGMGHWLIWGDVRLVYMFVDLLTLYLRFLHLLFCGCVYVSVFGLESNLLVCI